GHSPMRRFQRRCLPEALHRLLTTKSWIRQAERAPQVSSSTFLAPTFSGLVPALIFPILELVKDHGSWRIVVNKPKIGYVKPVIADYGDLRELTASHTTTGITDVPLGHHGQPAFS